MTIQESRKVYIKKKKDKGYVRINKWCKKEYKDIVKAFIDILSCHAEDHSSTEDFHEFIDMANKMAEKYHSEYNIIDN